MDWWSCSMGHWKSEATVCYQEGKDPLNKEKWILVSKFPQWWPSKFCAFPDAWENSSMSSLLRIQKADSGTVRQKQCKRLITGKFRDIKNTNLSCTIPRSHLTQCVAIAAWSVLGLYDMCKKLLKNIMKRWGQQSWSRASWTTGSTQWLVADRVTR